MKRVLKIVVILIVVFGVYSFLIPRPNQSFLYRTLPELQNKTAGLIGTSVAFFLDPSLYYRFEMGEADFIQLMEQLALEPVSPDDYAYYRDYVFGLHQAPFWHRWWWRPVLNDRVVLFAGERRGNVLTFLFVPGKQLVFLYIQNT